MFWLIVAMIVGFVVYLYYKNHPKCIWCGTRFKKTHDGDKKCPACRKAEASRASVARSSTRSSAQDAEPKPEKKTGCVILKKLDCSARETLDTISERFISFDVETTGLSRYSDRIIQIGAVLFDGCEPTERYSTLVNPEQHIPSRASSINHITDDMVADAPTESQVIPSFLEFFGDAADGETVIAAYNADFDMGFLSEMLARNGVDANLTYMDVLPLARRTVRGLENYKQSTVADCIGLQVTSAHSADDDAVVCGQILTTVLPEAKKAISRREKAAADKVPTPEEKGVCSYVIKLLQKNGRDTDKVRFEKRSQGEIRIKHPYYFAAFKLPKRNPLVFTIRSEDYVECSLPREPVGNDDAAPYYYRFTLSGLEDIDQLEESLMKGFDDVSRHLADYYSRHYDEAPYEASSFAIDDNALDCFIDAYRQNEAEKLRAAQEKAAETAAKEAEKERRQQERQRKKEEKETCPPSVTMPNARKIGQYDDDMSLIQEHESVSSASKAVGVSPKSIRDAAAGRQKHAAGFVWKYLDETE